jgi:hypothetical protein
MSGGSVGLDIVRFVNLCGLPVNICRGATLQANAGEVRGCSPSDVTDTGVNNGAPAGTSRVPLDYRFTLPFAGPDNTVSAAAMTTAMKIFSSRDMFSTSATGSTGASVPTGPSRRARRSGGRRCSADSMSRWSRANRPGTRSPLCRQGWT